MADIQEFIKQLQDTSLSFEEQKQALQMIEESLLQAKEEEQQAIEDDTTLIVDAVKVIESNLNEKFDKLANSPKLIGKDGARGADGKNGKDGLNGRDGKDGKDGEDGLDGQDGAYITEVEIALDDTLLITLSDGTQIKTSKEITGPKGDVGPQGPKGAKGDTGNRGVPGAGIATGGTSGQVLTKASNNDYDTAWTTNGSGTVTSITAGTGLSGGTITSSGTIAIDSTVATLTGSQTLTNKTLTSPTVNTPVISGGTIDNTVIGGTTPVAGTFTTITGQTEVLKGTGSNLFLYSEQFDNAYWSKTGATVTANSTTAPDGNVTADSLIENTANSEHGINNNSSTTIVANTIYIVSCYVKANGRTKGTIKYVLNSFATQIGADFDLTAGTISSAYIALGSGATNLVSSISNVGNGWFRVSVGGILDSTSTTVRGQILLSNGTSTTYTGNGTSGFYIWGCQFEIGSTANTYVPTTTTAVYGTPSLSFSGVAGIGLESNGALYVSPAGTGALQAQATTSSATGGNARGANAVDWQTSRSSATAVTSGAFSVIGGGYNNTASNSYSIVGGGYGNSVTTNSQYVSVLGGVGNGASGFASTTVGGWGNSATGAMNFIGGGYSNTGTANAAVTTQSATMNGTTAVTLSGSNASIKVGQYITGTYMPSGAYVAAISGTSLTLSSAASGSGTATLSFFTPHGVVVGGGNNQATGSYSFIGGGGDAGTAANRNAASGAWSSVLGGFKNTASGIGSVICGGGTYDGANGGGNTASGIGSFVGAGWGHQAISDGAVCLGSGNLANAQFSTAMGEYASTRAITGNFAISPCAAPLSAIYTNQMAFLVLARQTTDATATVLTSTTGAASGTNQVILPNNSAYYFKIEIIAGVTGGGNTSGWELKGVIKRGANAASTAIVGTVTKTLIAQDAGALTWVVNATADTTNGGITVTVTGQASTTIRWVARCTTTEMTY